jgi:hypothetical protein
VFEFNSLFVIRYSSFVIRQQGDGHFV